MTLPNFIIVGAAKSGTTSLYHYLAQHPDVFMCALKEPHYFLDWDKYVSDRAGYEKLFEAHSGQSAVGEASTGYLFDVSSPGRIRELLPGVRIIIMLRNPADMAFALWRHMRRLGKRGEKLSFAAALKAEEGRMKDPEFRAACTESWHGNFYYKSRAMYFEQVKRYIDVFGKERVKVIIFEEFKENPLASCCEVFSFLGVDPSFTPNITAHNVGRDVRHRGLHKLITEKGGILDALPGAVAGRLRGFLGRLNEKHSPRMDEALNKLIKEAYMPDIKRLEALIGRRISLWY